MCILSRCDEISVCGCLQNIWHQQLIIIYMHCILLWSYQMISVSGICNKLVSVSYTWSSSYCSLPLQWYDNERGGVSNHQPHDWLFNRLFRHRRKIYQSSSSLAFFREINRWRVNFPHKRPVTWTMFPVDDVIMANLVEKSDNLSYFLKGSLVLTIT